MHKIRKKGAGLVETVEAVATFTTTTTSCRVLHQGHCVAVGRRVTPRLISLATEEGTAVMAPK